MKQIKWCLLVVLAAILCAVTVLAAEGVPQPENGMQEKFDQLERTQQDEIYDLCEELCEDTCELIQKYAALGMIEQAAADGICSAVTQHTKQIREERQAPWLKMPGEPRKLEHPMKAS